MEWLNLDDSVNALSLLGAVAIVVLTVLIVGKYIKQIKDDKPEGELAGYNFDGIDEFKNDLPVGWAAMYTILIVWGFWYWFVGYPLNAYSQIGEWNEEVKEYQAKYESKWANADKQTLIDMGQSVFLVQCAPCHGETAEGMGGKAQNLVTWGKEDHIVSIVANGAQGLGYAAPMPPMMTDEDGAKKAAAYIMANFSAARATKYPDMVAEGKDVYEQVCAACHGMDGNGIDMVAPSLVNLVGEVLDKGKKGSIGYMPIFKNRFTDVQTKALGEYIYSLR
jgi:cytochrome c oxidase cbb3-type subunit 3